MLFINLILNFLLFYLPSASVSPPDMVFIKGGTFLMGQGDGEGDERPVHTVRLHDFYLGKYEITVAQYRLFCVATERAMPDEPAWGWQDQHPIINTSWHDATAYIAWLNKETNSHFRLPTEAEFEYVIRNGGKEGTYPWGGGLPQNENIADEALKKVNPSVRTWEGYNDGYSHTSPVGALGTNVLGVCDINGNIWEWCSDWYSGYPSESTISPLGPDAGSEKVGRGASYNADPWHTRSAGRSYVEPTFKKPGFRLAKDVE